MSSFRRIDSLESPGEKNTRRVSTRLDNNQAWDAPDDRQQVELQDALRLAKLGKKQVLKRNFDFVSMFAFTSVVIISWECTSLTLSLIPNIGSASYIFGLVIVFLGTMATFTTVGELASIATTAGGQHHWVFMLTPEPYRKLASFLTGCMAVFSWILFFASNIVAGGTIIQGLIVLNQPDYEPAKWHGTLIMWAIILLIVFFNTVAVYILPIVECAFLVVHVLGFLAVFIIMCYMPSKGDPSEMISEFTGSGGWPEGMTLMVALAALVFPFQGADATVHLSEEIHDAAVNVPRSMIASVAVDGVTAIAMVVAVMFGFVNVDRDAAFSSNTGWPFLYFYSQVTGNAGGATAMAAIVLTAIIASAISVATASSRLLWALARDGAIPYSSFLAKVDRGSLNPVNSVLLVNGIAMLITLINLGSSEDVLNEIFGISTAGFYMTYLVCAALLLWHRVRGTIKEPMGEDASSTLTIGPRGTYSINLVWGPWRLKKWWGLFVNIAACVYLVIVIFFSVWPATSEPSASEMNYSLFILIAVVLVSYTYYRFSASKRFAGPVVEIVL